MLKRRGRRVKIRDILKKNAILVDLKAPDKTEAITRLGLYCASLYNLDNAETIVNKLLARESAMSTGIGFGIAIPHARIEGIDHVYLVASRLHEQIEFDSIDDLPVDLVFLLLSPANTTTGHTEILSALSRIMSYEEVRKNMREAKNAEAFLHIISRSEDKYVQ